MGMKQKMLKKPKFIRYAIMNDREQHSNTKLQGNNKFKLESCSESNQARIGTLSHGDK